MYPFSSFSIDMGEGSCLVFVYMVHIKVAQILDI